MSASTISTALQSTSISSRAPSRKIRAARRRGRAPHEIESDEEIEREITTDDDSDDDDSSIDSDLGSESLSDDGHPHGRSEVVTPSTTQSPPPPELHGPIDGVSAKSLQSGPFVSATTWADMVTAENADGRDELPVIDFAELDQDHIEQHILAAPRPLSRKGHKRVKKQDRDEKRPTSAPPTSPPRVDDAAIPPEEEEHEEEPSTSDRPQREFFPQRGRMQSARRAYQQRLETDPSFVPKVGEFWGHDDRLLEKDLRGLSSWWRGRWQARGRGRVGFSFRGRGRGGFFGGSATPHEHQDGEGEADLSAPADIPPVERTWTHDGYEEMKRRDERRREQREQQPRTEEQQHNQEQSGRFGPQRGTSFRGRGTYVARGRGGFIRSATPTSHSAGRPWYAMRPERVWTKHHEMFLYLDPSMKPRPGQGPAYRVKLPGGTDHIVRVPPRSHAAPREQPPASVFSDDGEKFFTVRLPRRAGKEKAVEEAPTTSEEPPVQESVTTLVEEPATTVEELSIEEVFTVRTNIVPHRPMDTEVSSGPTTTSGAGRAQSLPAPSSVPMSSVLSQASSLASNSNCEEPSMDCSLSDPLMIIGPSIVRASSASPSAQIKETVLRRPSLSAEAPPPSSALSEPASRPQPPALPPLQTSFSPVPPTSPTFGSPYAFAPPLPHGIAMNHNGVAYELATGRPVYPYQQQPPPVFTPRSMMHGHMHHPSASVPFVPTHMHHHSHSTSSPDFLAQPHTPPMASVVDPATGLPIFSPARQSSRIEIRAPTDAADGRKPSSRPSGLHGSVSSTHTVDEAHAASAAQSSGNPAAPSNTQPLPAPMMEAPMAYPAYQPTHYYYAPEPYPYQPYMDMSPQVVQYEMYPADHRVPQPPMIYY
ncbi:hypothetical protein WOLCODRAFT_143244 [Wolfiporia cocos MD-104 SS10]|uniref:Btz domain-containing protein n=1 Tax=Wolfiporia cocos (strain MD-104) TaxID=742152 RepID=A0A2H3JPV4_WOLCO|nr:hypothetical protein WOLCODRAFT_143244 [Wolfiporia cocos MD-104 SS10]